MGHLDIATRMKSYERDDRLSYGPVIIRVDGKAFHTWVKENYCDRPFDDYVMRAMQSAMYFTAKQMQGFQLAYTQSDECTFLLNSDEVAEPWFANKIQKLVSVSASLFTYFFNQEYYESIIYFTPAIFDARAYSVPKDDWPNVFVWRQLDWERNSVSMLAQSMFSHNSLQGLSIKQLKEKCSDKKVIWDEYPDQVKYGSFCYKINNEIKTTSDKFDYYQLMDMVG